MTTIVSDSDYGTGWETGAPNTSEILGNCKWCGHYLIYASPGDPPADCYAADMDVFYSPPSVWRDFSLIDLPLEYGKICPYAQNQPGQSVGQFGIHEVRA